MDLIVENTLGKLRCDFSRKKYEKNTEKKELCMIRIF